MYLVISKMVARCNLHKALAKYFVRSEGQSEERQKLGHDLNINFGSWVGIIDITCNQFLELGGIKYF